MNEAPSGPMPATAAPMAAFLGDTGILPVDSRRVLCKLLSGPCIDRDSPLWPALLRDEATLRSRLAELFLELVLDADRRIAFTRPADTGELEAPALLRTVPLTYLDSVLILHLRQRLVGAELHGERAVVDESELIEHLAVFTDGDEVKGQRRIANAIEKMKGNGLLHAIRGADRRYEVMPTLRLLFGPDEVEAVNAAYRSLAGLPEAPDGTEDRHEPA